MLKTIFEEVDKVKLLELCRKRGYIWTPDLDRKYKFLLRSAKIKGYEKEEVDKIIVQLLRNNKTILSKRKSERLGLSIKSVENVLKNQVKRK